MARRKRYTIIDMKKIAQERGGNCLSKEYKNTYTKLIWQCENKHIWEATPKSILQDHWCRKCNTEQNKRTIEEMKAKAISKGGLCLSETYIDFHSDLTWKCSCGHVWDTPPSYVISSDSWCPKCANEKRKQNNILRAKKRKNTHFQKFVRFVESKGGKILSNYIDSGTNIKIECENGHIWDAIPNNITRKKNGTWCPECYRMSMGDLNRKYSILDAKAWAESRGGVYASEKYKNYNENLIWQCKFGHEWTAPFSRIRTGAWCPNCRIYIGEEKVRYIFQTLLNKKFTKTRKVLGSSKLELDGFNEELSIAFEHQGEQHYKFIEHFHRNEKEFKKRLKIDEKKRKLTKLKGITLIEIPFYITDSDGETIINYIKQQFDKNNINYTKSVESIDLAEIYKLSPIYETIQEIATIVGAEIISKEYLTATSYFDWKCHNGHTENSSYFSFKNTRGSCKRCEKEVHNKKRLIEANDYAGLKNGKCLSIEYQDAHSPLIWMCKIGHQWEAPLNRIKKDHWCPFCSREENEKRKDSLGRYK